MEHPLPEGGLGEFEYGGILTKKNSNGLPSLEKKFNIEIFYGAGMFLVAVLFSSRLFLPEANLEVLN